MKILKVSGAIFYDQRLAEAQAEVCRKTAIAHVLKEDHDNLPHYVVTALSNNGAIIGWIVTEDA